MSCQWLRSDGISIHRSFYFSNQQNVWGLGQLLRSIIGKLNLKNNNKKELFWTLYKDKNGVIFFYAIANLNMLLICSFM